MRGDAPLGRSQDDRRPEAASWVTDANAASLACSLHFWWNAAMRRFCRFQPYRNRSETPWRHDRSEIAQAPIWQANYLAVLPNIVFPVGRTTDLNSVGTLVSHFESPI